MNQANFKVEPHSFGARRLIHWPVCKKCGLVRLNNLLTDWSVRMGCDSEDHPAWPQMRVTLPFKHRQERGFK